MGKNGTSKASLACAFVAIFLCGGILALPGVIVDKLLAAWAWNMTNFGFGIFLQGVSALLGTRTTAWYLGTGVTKGSHSAATMASTGPQRRLLPACAALSAASGLALLYFLGIPWIGFALVGWAVGAFTVLANVTALGLGNSARMLTIINMAFTAGAVALPAATALLVATQETLALHNWAASLGLDATAAWKLAPAAAILAFLALCEPGTRLLVLSTSPQPTNAHPRATDEQTEEQTDKQSDGHSISKRNTTLNCAAIALVCYVGTEINLSNNWMPFLGATMGASESIIRLANPLYWLGLLAARITFSIVHPEQSMILVWLRRLGYSSLIIIGLAIAAALLRAAPLANLEVMGSLRQFISPWIVLVPCFLSGLAIGVSYSFILGAVAHSPTADFADQSWATDAQLAATTNPQTEELNRHHHSVTTTMHWGVLGAITLPPIMGAISEYLGYIASMSFVFLTQVIFTVAILVWQRQHKTLGQRSISSPHAAN